MANELEYAGAFTGPELEERLTQGTYLDAKAKGYLGTKEEFDSLLAALAVIQQIQPHIENKENPHVVTKTQVGLGNVDNESKQQMFTSPVFTGTPTTPLPVGDNNQQVVNVQYVINYINSGIDASKITSGVLSIERLPKGALERLVIVANDEARFALTTEEIQTGDTVKVEQTGLMYFVKDDSKLNSEEGYEPYTAGTATSVNWSGIIGVPSWITSEKPTYSASEVGALPANGVAESSKKVENSIVIKVNSGSTENTDLFTFDGSVAKNLNIVAGQNITLTSVEGGFSINASVDSYILPVASSEALGGIQIGFAQIDKKYPVELDENNKAFVSVPWVASSTTADISSLQGYTIGSAGGALSASDTLNAALGKL